MIGRAPPRLRVAFRVAVIVLVTQSAIVRAQLPGSVADERARLAELLGDTARAHRNRDALLSAWLPLGAVRRLDHSPLFLVEPAARLTWNSTIPVSLNDGAMWSGRGASFRASAGLGAKRLVRGFDLRAALAPEILYSQNLPFQMLPSRMPGRSAYASPFHGMPASADLPLRFGDRHVLSIVPGRTSVTIAARGVALGFTAEEEVWGPGIRNPLVLSANAPGIPRLFVRTGEPVRTGFGQLTGTLVVGALTESMFFDADGANDIRSFNGLVVALRPRFDSALTFGFARAVYAPVPSAVGGSMSHAFDVFYEFGQTRSDGTSRSDQLTSIFGRWVFPGAGLEVYGEFARDEVPGSLHEWLAEAHVGGAFTVGAQLATHVRSRDVLRMQLELTSLEQSSGRDSLLAPDFYTGRASPQGYSQHGQTIGAAIGPGASSQWIALDYLVLRGQAGVYVGRIRWENDAMYRLGFPTHFKHDVTVFGGARGVVRTGRTDFSVDATYGYRFNYLFQNGFANPGGLRTIDIKNFTLSVAASPR